MLAPGRLDAVLELGVCRAWFSDPRHGMIWDAILDCSQTGIDVTTISSRLNGTLEKAGGFSYLSGLPGASPGTVNLPAHAGIVRDAFLARTAQAKAQALLDAIASGAKLDTIRALAADVAVPESADADHSKDLRELSEQYAYDLMAEKTGEKASSRIYTSIGKLDRMLKVRGGHLVIIAGAPKMGKTHFALTVAINVGRRYGTVHMVSAEMGPEDLGERVLSSYGVDSDTSTVETIGHALHSMISSIPAGAVSVDTRSTHLNAVLASCRTAVRKRGAKALLVDYLQLLDLPEGENRTIAVGKACSAFKRLAKTLGVPVFLLSQLSRAYDKRNDHRPQPTDLRDSGQIEQDADAILGVYCPSVYEDTVSKDQVDIIVMRQRNGGTGVVSLVWRKGQGWDVRRTG